MEHGLRFFLCFVGFLGFFFLETEHLTLLQYEGKALDSGFGFF